MTPSAMLADTRDWLRGKWVHVCWLASMLAHARQSAPGTEAQQRQVAQRGER